MLIVLSIVLNLVLNLNHLAVVNSYLLAKMKKPEANDSGLLIFLTCHPPSGDRYFGHLRLDILLAWLQSGKQKAQFFTVLC